MRTPPQSQRTVQPRIARSQAGAGWVGLARTVRGLLGVGVTAMVVLAVAGCGGGSSSLPPGLDPYLIQGKEETGYTVQRPLEHYKTAGGYAAGEQDPTDAQRLARAGFQQALVENTGGGNGISYVLQFATASDATREQSYELGTDLASQGGLPFRFSASGVGDADGFGERPVGGQGDANALFREGRCLLLVGDISGLHPQTYEAAVVPASRRSTRGPPHIMARALPKRIGTRARGELPSAMVRAAPTQHKNNYSGP